MNPGTCDFRKTLRLWATSPAGCRFSRNDKTALSIDCAAQLQKSMRVLRTTDLYG